MRIRQISVDGFPVELERAFQDDYYSRMKRPMQIGLGIVAALTLVSGLRDFLPRPALFASGMAQYVLAPVALALSLLALTPTRWFARHWQPCGVAAFLIASFITMNAGISDVRQGIIQNGKIAEVNGALYVLMIIVASISRFQFRWAALCQCGVVAIWAWTSLLHLALEPSRVAFGLTLIAFPLSLVLFAAFTQERLSRRVFLSNHLLDQERRKSDGLLLNVMPAAIASRLRESPATIAEDHAEATVLFADVAGFTPLCAGKPAREVVQFLDELFSRFDALVIKHGLEKIKTVGDCYMVIAGAPTPRADHCEAAARFGLELLTETGRLSEELGAPLEMRVGMHTGPLVAGVIGRSRFLYDVWGDTVNTASRLESHGVPGRIQVSEEVAERLDGRFRLEPRGSIELKGKGRMLTYYLEAEGHNDGSASPTTG